MCINIDEEYNLCNNVIEPLKARMRRRWCFYFFGYMTEDMLSPDYFRWLYTAFTRATETLYLVNWPKEQLNE